MRTPQTLSGVMPVRPTKVTSGLDAALGDEPGLNFGKSVEAEIRENQAAEAIQNTIPKEEQQMEELDLAGLDMNDMVGNTQGTASLTEKSQNFTQAPATGAVAQAQGYGPKALALQSFGRITTRLCGFITKKDHSTIFGSKPITIYGADGKPKKVSRNGKDVVEKVTKFGLIGRAPSGFAGIVAEIPTQLIGVTARDLMNDQSIVDINTNDSSTTLIVDTFATMANILLAVTGGVVMEHEKIAAPGKQSAERILTGFGQFDEALLRAGAKNKASYFKISLRKSNLKDGNYRISPTMRNAASRPLVTPLNYIPLAKDEVISIKDLVATQDQSVKDGYAFIVNGVANDSAKSVKYDAANLQAAADLFKGQLSIDSFKNGVFLQPDEWYALPKTAKAVEEVAIPKRVIGTTKKDGVEVPTAKKATTFKVNKDFQVTEYNLGKAFPIDTVKLTILAQSGHSGDATEKQKQAAANQAALRAQYMSTIEAVEIGQHAAEMKTAFLSARA